MAPVKTKWTPEAEKRAAQLWNAHAETQSILRTLKFEHKLELKAEDLHSLLRRKAGVLGMIDGSDRQRALRPERVANRKMRKPSAGTRLVKAAKQAREMATEGIDIMEIRDGQCRYPLTKSLPHAFCGKKSNGSWCAEHLAIIKGKKS